MGRIAGGLAVALFLAPRWVHAQMLSTTYETPEQLNQTSGESYAIMADLGVNRYDLGLLDDTEPGVGYGARVDLSPTRNVGIELGYDGAVTNVVASSGQLVTNQVGGDLRINLIPSGYDLPLGFRPFILGGAAFQGVDILSYAPGFNAASLLAVPVGGGIELNLGKRFLIGARYTYNFLFDSSSAFNGRSANNWVASISLGARFER